MGTGIGEPEHQPAGASDEPPARAASGEGGEAPTTAPGAPSGSEPEMLARAVLAQYEWMHARPPATARWKVQVLWFVVALGAGSIFALLLLAFN